MGTSQAPAQQVRAGLSITQKLVALIVLTTGASVVFLTLYFPDQQIRSARAALERKAATYGTLVSKQVASAIAFSDRETAREVFDSVATDQDVVSLTLLTSAGKVLHERGHAGAWIEAAKKGVDKVRVVDVDDKLAVVAPVVSLEGPRGTLVIELTTAPLLEEKARITRTAVFAGAGALALGAIFAYFIARSLGRRVGAIAKVASAVAAGDLNQPALSVGGRDEVSVLAQAFSTMLAQIRGLVSQIKITAQEEQDRLEGLVAQRTRALDGRNAEMKLVLDNVDQGFLSVDLEGRISEERSAAVDKWFGAPKQGEKLWSYFGRAFPAEELRFRMSWEALTEDWMPMELRLDQLPQQLRLEKRYFGFSYKPILDGENIRTMLVVVSDHTAAAEQRLAEESERELVQSIRWLLSDRSGFEAFLAESDDLVVGIIDREEERPIRMRLIHTLKGNSAIFGFGSISRLCHEIEDRMAETDADMSVSDGLELRAAWDRLRERILPFVQGRNGNKLDVSRADYERALAQVRARGSHTAIGTLLDTWELEPADGRFRRVADYAEGLAERLGKGPIQVRVEANDVRLDAAEWGRFWQTIVHVVRNAIDHGLDTHDERVALGKHDEGALILRSVMRDGHLRIEVEDNGRGIDWAKVANAARKAGLPANTQAELDAALFSDSLTTAEHATTTSGRGVGLSAVRQLCVDTGGKITIVSKRGVGTTFSFEWAVDALGRRRVTSERPAATGSGVAA